MMKKYLFTVALSLSGLGFMMAQTNTYSGYFMDNFLYRHQMNPAMGNDENFVGFPGLGNLNIGTEGTFHLNKIFYPMDGKTVLFTNPYLPEGTVKNFADFNKIGANFRENIINCGFKALGGYNTISISAVMNSQIGVPGSLFNMLKDGVKNDTYDIKNFRVYANAYAEIALNHSRDIKQVPGLRVGASFKFLVGMANAYGHFNRAQMILGENSWDIISDGEVYLSAKGVKFDQGYNHHANRPYVNGVNTENFSAPNGFGATVDLGATYKWRDFNFSLAVLDLGGIAWTDTQKAWTNGEQHFQSDKYTFEIDGDEGLWDQMKDQITALYQLQPVEDNKKRSTMQGATLNIGVEYELPYYRPLTFGLLNTTRMCGGYTFTEFRLSANVTPVKYVSATANLVCGTYGVGFGWLLNFTTVKGFNLFLGMDRTPGKLMKQYLPLNSNLDVNIGINFPF